MKCPGLLFGGGPPSPILFRKVFELRGLGPGSQRETREKSQNTLISSRKVFGPKGLAVENGAARGRRIPCCHSFYFTVGVKDLAGLAGEDWPVSG